MVRRVVVTSAVAIALALSGCGTGDEPDVGEPLTSDSTTTTTSAPTEQSTTTAHGSPTGKVIELSIVGGSPEGGVLRETVQLNEKVTLLVMSDVADEVHVHGYDLKVDLVPGTAAELSFDATIPGVFEVELEGRHRQILRLEVRP